MEKADNFPSSNIKMKDFHHIYVSFCHVKNKGQLHPQINPFI